LKKQNQSRPLAGNPKSEYLNPKRFDGCVLKKQSQFLTEANALKVNYDKEIRENNRIGHLVKTNPIYLAPRFILGIENEVEKTNPISKWANRRKLLFERRL
jgi:hypothetical protein